MHTGARIKLVETLTGIAVLPDCARLCVCVLFGLEWIKRALLYQLSYAPTVLQSNILQRTQFENGLTASGQS
jgi:hypothetical protein